MKRIIYFIVFILTLNLSILNAGYFYTNQEPMGIGQGVNLSSIEYGDIDNDGDLDIALSGNDGANRRFIIFRNDSGTFTNIQEPMGANQGVDYSSLAFGDIDNDGDLDLALTGNDGANNRLIIFRNHNGNFVSIQEPLGMNKGVFQSSIVFGDIDNDGDLDIALSGTDGTSQRLIIFRNDSGTFVNTQEPMGLNQGVEYASIAFGDIDNDGDLDLAVTGYDGANRRFIIFDNDSGAFVKIHEPMGVNKGFYQPNLTFGDIDDDGDLDIAVAGNDGVNRRFIIFRNDSGTFVNIQEPMGVNQGVEYPSTAFGDMDNDGDLDIVLSGWSGSGNRFIIFRNDSGTLYTNQEPMGVNQGVNTTSSAFGDINNNNDLDISLTGSLGPRRFIIFTNNELVNNNLPNVPSGLVSEKINGFWRFKWNSSIDEHTIQILMHYKIAISTNKSGIYNYISDAINYPRGQANVGNVPQGWLGSSTCYYQSTIPVSQTVYWKVCAIDTAFQRSDWSEEQSTLQPQTSLQNLTVGPNPYKPNDGNPASGSGNIIFDKLTADAVMEIYTMQGQLVEKLTEEDGDGKYTWTVPDRIASGMYVCRIKNNSGEERVVKLMIIK